jgi:hypothetical protein
MPKSAAVTTAGTINRLRLRTSSPSMYHEDARGARPPTQIRLSSPFNVLNRLADRAKGPFAVASCGVS